MEQLVERGESEVAARAKQVMRRALGDWTG
jgi:hypothetical protein